MVAHITVKVKDLMNPNLISVESGVSIMEAIRTMTDHEIGSIVVTRDGVPVGIVTERDCLKKVCGKLDCSTVPVGEIMSTPLITVESDASLYTAVIQMLSHNIRRLLVTHNGPQNGGLAGAIGTDDRSNRSIRYFQGNSV